MSELYEIGLIDTETMNIFNKEVYIDAICGMDISFRNYIELTKKWFAKFNGFNHKEIWEINRNSLENMDYEKLVELYKSLKIYNENLL